MISEAGRSSLLKDYLTRLESLEGKENVGRISFEDLKLFDYDWLRSEDLSERRLSLLALTCLLKNIIVDKQFCLGLKDSQTVKGPFVVVDSILYLSFSPKQINDAHQRIYKTVTSRNKKIFKASQAQRSLFDYSIERLEKDGHLVMSFGEERLLEILSKPHLLSCVPDPLKITIFIKLGIDQGKHLLASQAEILFQFMDYRSWKYFKERNSPLEDNNSIMAVFKGCKPPKPFTRGVWFSEDISQEKKPRDKEENSSEKEKKDFCRTRILVDKRKVLKVGRERSEQSPSVQKRSSEFRIVASPVRKGGILKQRSSSFMRQGSLEKSQELLRGQLKISSKGRSPSTASRQKPNLKSLETPKNRISFQSTNSKNEILEQSFYISKDSKSSEKSRVLQTTGSNIRSKSSFGTSNSNSFVLPQSIGSLCTANSRLVLNQSKHSEGPVSITSDNLQSKHNSSTTAPTTTTTSEQPATNHSLNLFQQLKNKKIKPLPKAKKSILVLK